MNRLDETPSGDGPIIDVEPAASETPETPKPQARAVPRKALMAGAGVLAIAAAMLAGAYAYGRLGLDTFGGSVSDRLGAMETRLATVEQNAVQHTAERQAIADRLDGLGQAMEGLSGLQARITSIEAQQAALGSSVEALQNVAPGQGGADAALLAQIQAEVKDLQARLAAVPRMDPVAARLVSAFGSGQPLGADIDGLSDADVKSALVPYRDQAAPSRAALSQELAQIAAGLNVPAPVAEERAGEGWDGFFYRQLSRFFTIRPAGAALAHKLEAAARAQDVAGGVALLQAQSNNPEAASAWLAKAQGWLGAQAALERLKAGGN